MLDAALDVMNLVGRSSNSPTFDFDQYIRNQFGFYTNLHVPSPIRSVIRRQASSMSDVLKFMQWSFDHSTVPKTYETAYINFFNLLSQEDLSRFLLPNSFDICPHRANALTLDQRRFYLRQSKLGDKVLYWISTPANSNDLCDWLIGTKRACTVLQIYRSNWKTMHDIAKGLLACGAQFCIFIPTSVPRAPEVGDVNLQGLGHRPDTYEPTEKDIEGYLLRLKDLMTSPAGRALRLHGGIVGRLAREFVRDEDVLLGPISHTTVISFQDGHGKYAGDGSTEDDFLVACGVYMMHSKTGIQKLSWWPQDSVWSDSGLSADVWMPIAERFYLDRWKDIKNGMAKLYSSTAWKHRLRGFKPVTGPIHSRFESFSKDFVSSTLPPY